MPLFLPVRRPRSERPVRSFLLFLGLLLGLLSTTPLLAQQYTENFDTAPAITNGDPFPDDHPYLSNAEVTLGGVVYVLQQGTNASWTHGQGALQNNGVGGDVTVKLFRKDSKSFNFYGIKLTYSNLGGYPAPYLTVKYYAPTGQAPPDETFGSNQTVTLSKQPVGMTVTSIYFQISGLNNLSVDDLIVGPAPNTGPAPISLQSISRIGSSPTNAAAVQFAVTFSGAVSGLTAANFSLTTDGLSGAALTGVAGASGGASYTVTVGTGSGDGTLRLNLANSTGLSPTVTNAPFTTGPVFSVDKSGPTVSSVSVPANGTYAVGESLDFVVNFNDEVMVTGSPDLPITVGSTARTATYTGGSGTSALRFRYTVACGDFDDDGIQVGSSLRLNGGAVTDELGNAAVLALNEIGSTVAVSVDARSPRITAGPGSGSAVCAGGNTVLSVTATGPSLHYQWKRNGAVNVGADSPNLSLQSIRADAAGTYTVEVSNACGGPITSSGYSLTVVPETAIVTQPGSGSTVCAGADVRLSVEAAGSNLHYQWRRGNLNVGVDSPQLNLSAVQVADGGAYTVLVTGDCGSLSSSAFALLVNPTPQLTVVDPAAVCTPATVNLTNGVVSTDVGGSTYAFYIDAQGDQVVASPGSIAVGGVYYVRATSPAGCRSAVKPIVVTINPSPPAPDYASSPGPGDPYPAGQTSLVVTQYSGSVTFRATNCNGQLKWSGPGGSGLGDIQAPTAAIGTFVYSGTCTSGQGCASPPSSVTVTVQAGALAGLSPVFDCSTGLLRLRTVGGNGNPFEYQIVSVVTAWTPASVIPIPSGLQGKTLRIRIRQQRSGSRSYDQIEFDYRVPTCPNARTSAEVAPDVPTRGGEWQVTVLGNPVGESIQVEIRGADGRALRLLVTDGGGRVVEEKRIGEAQAVERHSLPVGRQPAGVLLLRVSTPDQVQVIRLVKP